MQKQIQNAKQIRSKQLMNSDDRIKPGPSGSHHQKVNTANFNKDFVEKVNKDNQNMMIGPGYQEMMPTKNGKEQQMMMSRNHKHANPNSNKIVGNSNTGMSSKLPTSLSNNVSPQNM